MLTQRLSQLLMAAMRQLSILLPSHPRLLPSHPRLISSQSAKNCVAATKTTATSFLPAASFARAGPVVETE